MGNPQFVILCVALTFAAVLEAAPRYYPEPGLVPQHHHRYHRQTYPYNAGKHFQHIDQQNDEEDLYELRPSYDYQRYPRDDGTTAYNFLSMTPSIVRDRGIGTTGIDGDFYSPLGRYVVPSIAEDSEYQIVDDNLNYTPNYRDLDTFPISMMRQESSRANQRHVLTDRELGKILRKALESANYGNVERASSIKRFNSAPAREPARGSDLAHSPQARSNYPRHWNEPKTNVLAKLAPEPVDETLEKDADGSLVDVLDDFENSRSETDLVATIAESTESPEDQPETVADLSLTVGEMEPVTHQIDENEGSSDVDVEKDVILAIIEYEDSENENEDGTEKKKISVDDPVREDEGSNDKIVPVAKEESASPVKEEDSKITDIEEDFSLADDIHEPLLPIEELYTEDPTTDATIEPTAE